MGLFDKILGGQSSDSATLTAQDAVAGMLLVTVAADGHISDEEKECFIATSNRMKLFRDQSPQEFNSMMDRLFGYLRKHGAEWLMAKAATSMPSEIKATVFALCADLVFADGSVEADEQQLIESIHSKLGIQDDLALKILEVVQIKNRG